MRSESAFQSLIADRETIRPLFHKTRRPTARHRPKTPTEVIEPVPNQTGTSDFYDRLQRIWERILLLEDMGIVRNESDKFKYAYQLAEAEIQEMCRQNAGLR